MLLQKNCTFRVYFTTKLIIFNLPIYVSSDIKSDFEKIRILKIFLNAYVQKKLFEDFRNSLVEKKPRFFPMIHT